MRWAHYPSGISSAALLTELLARMFPFIPNWVVGLLLFISVLAFVLTSEKVQEFLESSRVKRKIANVLIDNFFFSMFIYIITAPLFAIVVIVYFYFVIVFVVHGLDFDATVRTMELARQQFLEDVAGLGNN